MATQLNAAQRYAILRDNRQLTDALYPGGMAQLLQDLADDINSGAAGVTAQPYDVDALAKDGGHFAWDEDSTDDLDFAYFAGRIYDGSAIVDVAAGSVTLSASTTNYVECSRAGVVSKNTIGFTAGAIPLYVVVTGVGITAAGITNKKCLIAPPLGKVIPVQESVATVNATGLLWKLRAPCAGSLASLGEAVGTTIATDNTNYWTFTAVNKGPAGTGTTDMLALSDANTTKTTGGSALTANVMRSFTLHGTAGNLVVAKNDIIHVTATKAASAADQVLPVMAADFTFTG